MQTYVALVPVKPPALGKSRLVGLADDERRALAAAFALDTVAACLAVDRDRRGAGRDRRRVVLRSSSAASARPPSPTASPWTSTAPCASPRPRRADAGRVLVPVALTADLPAVRATDLDEALGDVAPGEAAYVADADGLGTTLYTAAHDAFDPRFGPGSALAHDATGARPITAALPRLRRDVDDLDDLADALALGVGPRTAERAASH